MADEMAIGVINHKTTAVRVIPVPGKGVGDEVSFGGLLGKAATFPGASGRRFGLYRPGRTVPGRPFTV